MNILVPTDFSHDAYNALYYATQLYKHRKCTFVIIHVYDLQSDFRKDYSGRINDKGLRVFLNERSSECLRETHHKIIADTENNPLHNFITIPIYDHVISGIRNYLKTYSIHLLVMGNKGRTGAKEIFLGGNTIQMVKSKISCPVLCVPKEIDFKKISQMAFLTDYKHILEEDSMHILRSLALTYEASIHVLYICNHNKISPSQAKNKVVLSDYFEEFYLQFHSIPCEESKAMTISHFVERHQIDLLAMVYYRHFLLDKLFREPLVLDLSFYVEVPMFIIPDQD